MSWKNIAKKDFEDSIRSKNLWIVTFIFISLIAGSTFALTLLPRGSDFIGDVLSSNNAIIALQSVSGLLVPIIALMIGYMAVAGEREYGTIKTLLGLPNTRFDVVLGKWIGRSLVVIVPIIISFAVASVVILVFYEVFFIMNYLIFFVITLLLAISFLSIAIGFSAASDTKGKALGWAISVFFVFQFLWDTILLGIHYLINRSLPAVTPQQGLPAWFVFLQRITPNGAFGALSNTLMDLGELSQFTDISQLIGQETIPFYLQEYVFLLILFLWIILPPILGYLVFKKSDIN